MNMSLLNMKIKVMMMMMMTTMASMTMRKVIMMLRMKIANKKITKLVEFNPLCGNKPHVFGAVHLKDQYRPKIYNHSQHYHINVKLG